jgi:hypothetical protein
VSEVARDASDKARLRIALESNGPVAADTLEWRVRDDAGEYVAQQVVPVDPLRTVLEVNAVLPPLRAGSFLADVWLRQGDRVVTWGSGHFTVTSPQRVERVAADRPFLTPGEAVTFTIELTQPAGAGTVVELAGRDAIGRQVERAELAVLEGGQSVTHLFTLAHSCSNLLEVEARLRMGEEVLARAILLEPVDLPVPHDDFSWLIWGYGSSDFYWRYANDLLYQYGVDTVHHGQALAHARSNLRGLAGIRAGLHFNERKEENHVRTPCLTDPAHREVVRQRLHERAREYMPFGVTGYTLGDDNVLGSGDICMSPTCLADFRKYAQQQYGDLAALNAEWETDYKTWEEVHPLSLDELREGEVPAEPPGDAPTRDIRNAAPWFDHRMHMESVWADFHRFAEEATREVDPDGRVGSDAACGWGSYRGYDWWKLCQAVSLCNTYPDPLLVELLRCFHRPDAYTGLWYGGYLGQRYENYERWLPWYCAFHQLAAAWWFKTLSSAGETCQEDALAADLRPFAGFVASAEEVNDLKAGVGKLLLAARPESDGIAILYSQPSIHAATLGNPFGDHYQAMKAVIDLLEDLGSQYDFVAYEQVARGVLAERGYRAVILPYAQALSPAERQALLLLARGGGLVLADVRPGQRDGHGKVTDDGAWNGFWGVHWRAAEPLKEAAGTLEGSPTGIDLRSHLEKLTVDAGVEVVSAGTGAAALGQATAGERTAPLLIQNRIGGGLTLLLNFPFATYAANSPNGARMRSVMKAALAEVGIPPRYEVQSLVVSHDSGVASPLLSQPLLAPAGSQEKGEDGTTVADYEPFRGEVVAFADGPLHYLGLLKDPRSDRPSERLVVRLREPAHVYAARTGEYFGETAEIRARLYHGEAQLYALLPYSVQGVRVEAPERARPGEVLKVSLRLSTSATPGRHVLSVRVFGPDGKRQRHYDQNVWATEDRAEVTIPLALNDAPGRWRITARDAATGVTGEAWFELAAD